MCGDGSEYARRLTIELASLGAEVVEFDGAEDLERVLDGRLAAVVLVSPRTRLASTVRAALERAGGRASRVPLIVALGGRDLLPETDTLRYSDDFLIAPAGAAELVSRVEVITLKRGGHGNVIHRGDLVVNLDAHQVFLDGSPVDFTYKEFELLKMMAATPGRAYSREELLRKIWGYDYFGGTRTVDVHVRRLRAKLEGSSGHFIETVHGVGYRFVS